MKAQQIGLREECWRNWLYAAKAGIPTAFIIDKKGIISFIGHPDEIDDALIEEVLAGKFDLKRRALARKEAAAKAEAWEKHNEAGRLAWQAKEWDKAMREIDELEKLFPQNAPLSSVSASRFSSARVTCRPPTIWRFNAVMRTRTTPFYSTAWPEPSRLRRGPNTACQVPSAICFSRAPKTMSFSIRPSGAARAITMLNGPEPEFLHTQAQLAFLQGKREKAIQLSTEALALTEPGINDQFAEALESFKNGRLPQ